MGPTMRGEHSLEGKDPIEGGERARFQGSAAEVPKGDRELERKEENEISLIPASLSSREMWSRGDKGKNYSLGSSRNDLLPLRRRDEHARRLPPP